MRFSKLYIFILLFWNIFQLTGCRPSGRETSTPDTALVKAVLETFKDSVSRNPQFIIDTLLKIQPHLTDSLMYHKLSNLLIKAYYFNNQLDSSLAIGQRIIDFYERQPDNPEIKKIAYDAYNSRGVFLINHMRDSAIVCFHKTYELMRETGEMDQSPDVCINLADSYQLQGDFTSCSYYYRRALTLSDSLNLGKKYNLSILSGIAKIYHQLENFDLAEYYYNQANNLLDGHSDMEKFFFTNAYGTYNFTIKDYDKALECFRQAKHHAQKISRIHFEAIATGNIGEIFIWKEQPDSARYYLDLATQYFGDLSNQTAQEFYMNGLYASLALLENNLPEAERLLMRPFDASQIQPQYQYYHHKRLHEFYLRKKDFRKAYQYYAQTVIYDDSLRNIKTRNNIAEIDSRYRQDTILIRKDMQIALTESRATQWQNIALLSIVSLFLTAGFVIGIILYRRKIRELRYQKQVSTITGLRMEIVRNRLSPHFVFNALNTVMPTLENYKELQEPFCLLIQLLRNNLQASEQTAIPLENEVMLVKDYLRLRTLKESTGISIHWQIEEGVPMDTLVPSMSIQIPVENAVKYAFTNQSTAPYIRIQVSLQHKFLKIIIEDNDVGLNTVKDMNDKRGTGSGLKMLYRTIEILNTKNDEKMIFSIENRRDTNPSEEGTRVSLVVPLHYTFEL